MQKKCYCITKLYFFLHIEASGISYRLFSFPHLLYSFHLSCDGSAYVKTSWLESTAVLVSRIIQHDQGLFCFVCVCVFFFFLYSEYWFFIVSFNVQRELRLRLVV